MKEMKDFKKFMSSDENPPRELDLQVTSLIERNLKHLPKNVFFKALGIHWFAGALTLLICPQFGWNPFSVSPHLPHVFMQYGMWACGLFCGSLFMAFGAVGTRFFAAPTERLYLQRKGLRFAFLLAGLSLVFLMTFGGASGGTELYFTESFISFWLVGAFLFDALSFKGLYWRAPKAF